MLLNNSHSTRLVEESRREQQELEREQVRLLKKRVRKFKPPKGGNESAQPYGWEQPFENEVKHFFLKTFLIMKKIMERRENRTVLRFQFFDVFDIKRLLSTSTIFVKNFGEGCGLTHF